MKKRFTQTDRVHVINGLEKQYNVRLSRIGHRQIYLHDEHRRRYIVLGGYGDWHGIHEEIFDTEERVAGDTLLVIAKHLGDRIDIYAGPMRSLLVKKRSLPTTVNKQYVFNIDTFKDKLRIREAPDIPMPKVAEELCRL